MEDGACCDRVSAGGRRRRAGSAALRGLPARRPPGPRPRRRLREPGGDLRGPCRRVPASRAPAGGVPPGWAQRSEGRGARGRARGAPPGLPEAAGPCPSHPLLRGSGLGARPRGVAWARPCPPGVRAGCGCCRPGSPCVGARGRAAPPRLPSAAPRALLGALSS